MTDIHWAILALRDINSALDRQRYDVASHHIDDAIFAIMARDAQDGASRPRVAAQARAKS
ncbi:hypothetical protein [Roseobacter sinensis]|uniref:Uncharacterized protein n=1 Tax=Roseobacter sinensis TaxID=2931391 RepID=A0ABT3BBL3_9RHOB|nr:hypothetical protein [Roseobacter sp. WL0113]MCV3270935.1 hypothetical protein [Roseobacter sp. WL0113]